MLEAKDLKEVPLKKIVEELKPMVILKAKSAEEIEKQFLAYSKNYVIKSGYSLNSRHYLILERR